MKFSKSERRYLVYMALIFSGSTYLRNVPGLEGKDGGWRILWVILCIVAYAMWDMGRFHDNDDDQAGGMTPA